MTTTIELYRTYKSDTLRSRKTAHTIIENIFNTPYYEDTNVDFKNIIFASRSFCHELLTGINNRKNVHLVNIDADIKKMCDVATIKPEIKFNIAKEENILSIS